MDKYTLLCLCDILSHSEQSSMQLLTPACGYYTIHKLLAIIIIINTCIVRYQW